MKKYITEQNRKMHIPIKNILVFIILFSAYSASQILYAQVNENKLLSDDYKSLQETLLKLSNLGYRQMPADMQETLLAKAHGSNSSPLRGEAGRGVFEHDNNLQYISLSENLFPELESSENLIAIGNTQIDIQSQKISFINSNENLADPITFALTIDPLAEKFPSESPYSAMDNDPINMVDPSGKSAEFAIWAAGYIGQRIKSVITGEAPENLVTEDNKPNSGAIAEGVVYTVGTAEAITGAAVFSGMGAGLVAEAPGLATAAASGSPTILAGQILASPTTMLAGGIAVDVATGTDGGTNAVMPSVNGAMDGMATVRARIKVAEDFFRRAEPGITEEKLTSYLKGIDFSQPVYIDELPEGTMVDRFGGAVDGTGEPVPGSWASDAGSDIGNRGLPPEDQFLGTFEVTKPTKVLVSTAADIVPDWIPGQTEMCPGGTTQFYVSS